MHLSWDIRNLQGLATNICAAIGVACLANAFAFLSNPPEVAAPSQFRFDPPGYVVGAIWILLFAALGTARWLVLGKERRKISNANAISALLFFCAAYPVYTLGLRSQIIGLLGNLATALFALWVTKRLWPQSHLAALLVSAVAVWVSFASVLTWAEIQGGLS